MLVHFIEQTWPHLTRYAPFIAHVAMWMGLSLGLFVATKGREWLVCFAAGIGYLVPFFFNK